MQTNVDAHEQLACLDVGLQCRNDTLAFEGGHTMPEIAHAAKEDFLEISLGRGGVKEWLWIQVVLGLIFGLL